MSDSNSDRAIAILLKRLHLRNGFELAGVSRPDMRAVIECVVTDLTDNGLLVSDWEELLKEQNKFCM